MLTKEQRSLWFDWRLLWFDRLTNRLSKYTNRLSKYTNRLSKYTNRLSKYTNRLSKYTNRLSKYTNRLSKRPAVADSGAFDWFDWLTSRQLVYFDKRLVSLPNHRHRSNASAYFVDHHPFWIS
jgi:hypothetical protein